MSRAARAAGARQAGQDRMYRIGVDIGGTFTDFALFDARGGKMSVHKRLTTPHDPSAGGDSTASTRCSQREGVAIADVTRCRARHDARHQRGDRAHGRGHRHAGDGRLQRHPRYGLRAPLRPVRPARQVSAAAGAAPAAPRGAGARALRRQRRAAARRGGGAAPPRKRFQELGVAAVAVCFLHSYANPAHEARAAEILREAAPGPVRLRLGRRLSQHARVRALDDDDRQRLHAADVRPLPRAAGEGPGRAGLSRPPLHHGLERRHADGRHGAALPGARARSPGPPPAR